ncbi:hypothetical protein [Pedobacter riviphilus]|uniref:hypothetical protein n=1 Tax=Pedobacter riviphilus TaxID=2766984 RepID=UPI002E80B5FA|nr:hypothetical protein [Pedobacter riviphilus]
MNVIRKIEHWGDVHHSKWLDYLRIVLGLIIFGKGVSFVSDTSVLQNMITQNNVFGFSGMLISVAIHVVAFAHLVGVCFNYFRFGYPLCRGHSDSNLIVCCVFC